MDKIAVLLPCYNESQTIGKVVRDFRAALPEAVIYVYDNNSTDGTDQIAREASAVVRYARRQGKGNVIRAMFREIEAECYIVADGDDTYPAEAAPDMVRLILEENYDMVLGDRLSSTYFTENKRRFHNTGNRLVRTLVNSFFKGNVTDIMTGYRAFSRLFVKAFPALSEGFEIETEMTIHALDKRFSIASLPISYRDRREGSLSKLNTLRDGYKVLKTIGLLVKDYRPLPFFSVVAAVLALLAVVLVVPVLLEYSHTGLVPRLPTFVTACFFFVFALLSLMCGLILDTQRKYNRQTFELYLNVILAMENPSPERIAERQN